MRCAHSIHSHRLVCTLATKLHYQVVPAVAMHRTESSKFPELAGLAQVSEEACGEASYVFTARLDIAQLACSWSV
eukprot:3548022-Amphidinium_carterae.1